MTFEQHSTFNRRQWVVLVAVGASLWFGAALLIRAIEPLGALHLPGLLLTYALLIPGTVPFVVLTRRIAGLRREQTALGVMTVTATAALLDGIALTLFPAIYGVDPAGAAIVLLWGIGVGLALGLAMSKPRAAAT